MRKRNLSTIGAAICLVLVLAGCGRSDENAERYSVRGVVRGISPDRTTLEIQHENIPDFMPSMTMPFLVRDQKEAAKLKLGDAISFRMTVTKTDFWIDQIKKIRREEVQVSDPKPKATPESEASRLKEGDNLPAFSLTDQNGQQISPDTFKGRPLVLTFIFTRCPVPNFCPRMTSNFSELQKLVAADQAGAAKTHLLSVTLDPAFDSPEILKQYGTHANEDPNIWSLATGNPKEVDALTEAFSVYRKTEGGTLSHGLATALVSPEGKIVKIWRGNAWTPQEVISEIDAKRF